VRGVVYHADEAFGSLMHDEFGGGRDARRLPSALREHLASRSDPFRGNAVVVRCTVTAQGLLFLKARSRLPVDRLTERERSIARLLAQGGTHKHVARALNRSPATVRNRTQAIYEKLGIHGVAELAAHLEAAD